MIPYSDVRKLKKREKESFYIEICKKVGLVLTWIILNVFPSITANAATISMLFVNILASILVFQGVTNHSWGLIICSFLLFNFSICLDCADGNIARYKKQQSLYGVFLDRLVHNISYPLLYTVAGIAIFNETNSFIWFLAFLLTGILTELSPIEVALENVENLFIQQLITGKTQVYAIEDYMKTSSNATNSSSNCSEANNRRRIIYSALSFFPSWNRLYLAMFIDIVFPSTTFFMTKALVVCYSLRLVLRQISTIKQRIVYIQEKLTMYDSNI